MSGSDTNLNRFLFLLIILLPEVRIYTLLLMEKPFVNVKIRLKTFKTNLLE
jgi:hypothetical protein